MTDLWAILRCANCKTLELAASLNDAGFEAWSPVETVARRSRAGARPEPVRLPLIASFVFASAAHLQHLLELSHSPVLNFRVWDPELRRMVTRGHPYFRIPNLRTVPDVQLAGLRAAEAKRRPKGKPKVFATGALVRITEGGFEGMVGRVEECRGDYATVAFDDWVIPAKVATWLLHPALDAGRQVHVSRRSSEQALSAKAA
jgi:hypothetical protein